MVLKKQRKYFLLAFLLSYNNPVIFSTAAGKIISVYAGVIYYSFKTRLMLFPCPAFFFWSWRMDVWRGAYLIGHERGLN